MTEQGKKISIERNNSQTTKQKLPTIVPNTEKQSVKCQLLQYCIEFFLFHVVEKGEKKTRTDSK